MNLFKISINDKNIKDGIYIPFEESQTVPKISFNQKQQKKFTILMVDPDAPSRSNPIYKYWLHLLTINNNNNSNSNNNNIIVNYEPPSPPKKSGKHRYIFYLLEQSHDLNKDNIIIPKKFIDKNGSPKERNNFNLGEFIENNKLKIIDSIYFETEKK